MKKYLIASLVAVVTLMPAVSVFASQDREQENRGRGISEEVKAGLKLKQDDKREDRREDRKEDRRSDEQLKKDLERVLKFVPRAITFNAKLVVASTVSAFNTSTTSTPITVSVTKVMSRKPKQMNDPAVVYPEVGKNIVLNLTNKTHLARGFWGKMKLSDMAVGDELRIVAKYNKDGSLTLISVKDNSLHMLSSKKGVVQSIDAAMKSFVFKQDNRSLTVKTDAETKFVSRVQDPAATIGFTDLKVGDSVKVEGLINTNLNTVVKAKLVTVKAPAPTPAPAQ